MYVYIFNHFFAIKKKKKADAFVVDSQPLSFTMYSQV